MYVVERFIDTLNDVYEPCEGEDSLVYTLVRHNLAMGGDERLSLKQGNNGREPVNGDLNLPPCGEVPFFVRRGLQMRRAYGIMVVSNGDSHRS